MGEHKRHCRGRDSHLGGECLCVRWVEVEGKVRASLLDTLFQSVGVTGKATEGL